MKLSLKLLRHIHWRLAGVILATLCTILVAVAGSHWLNQYSAGEIASTLEAILRPTKRALAIWKEDTIGEAARAEAYPPVHAAILRTLQAASSGNGGNGGGNGGGGEAGANSPETLKRDVAALTDALGYGIVAFSQPAEISASDGATRKILSNLPPDIFAQVRLGKNAISHPLRATETAGAPARMGHFNIVVAVPVRNGKGNIVAAFCLRYDASNELQEIASISRWQNSGETYFFDKNGGVITSGRFKETVQDLGLESEPGSPAFELRDPGGNLLKGYHPALPRSEQPLTRMAQSATQGNSGVDVAGYRDYRGVPVAGAWSWDAELELGVATEIDMAEAYRGSNARWKITAFLMGVTLLGAVFATALLIREERQRAAVRNREDLLDRVAHDLRNPLNSISLSMETLKKLRESASPPAPEIKLMRAAAGAVARMKYLISDLLDAAKIESGNFTLSTQAQKFAAIAERAMLVLEPLAANAGIRLSSDIPEELPLIQADDGRVIEVLSNLVGNALKFTAPGGEIAIRAEEQDGAVQVCVSDTGCGIPPLKLERIFQRNWQTASSSQGLGLGLFISKNIVEAHGGKIWAESRVNAGTRIYFTLKAV